MIILEAKNRNLKHNRISSLTIHTMAKKMEVRPMATQEDKKECDLCGYTASGKFTGDICPQCNLTYWRCSKCNFTISATKPPEECPSCHQKCEFRNITCYTPDCGGPGHIDPQL